MGIYTTAAVVGTTSFAVGAAIVAISLGSGSGIGLGTFGSDTHDIRMAPYMARMSYQGGGAGLAPVSLALRVHNPTDGKFLCQGLRKAEVAIQRVLRKEITPNYQLSSLASSGVDAKLQVAVNRALGKDAVAKVLIAPGDVTLSGNLITCISMARK